MAHPETLVKEYKYTRYLHSRFPEWIVEELRLEEENKPLARILSDGRGLLITKKANCEKQYRYKSSNSHY